jgi:hypothetical protein
MVEKEFRLLSFQFNKILVEKESNFKGKITNPTSDINIKSIEKDQILLIKEEPLKIDFSFKLKFGDLGKLEMDGSLLVLLDKESKDEVLSEWKSKKLPEKLRLIILNIILHKSSLRALQLEEEMGLPLHIQLPRLQLEPKEQSKEDKK